MAQKNIVLSFIESIDKRLYERFDKSHIIKNTDPYVYQKKEFGKVGFSFETIKSQKEAYAEVFSEGNSSLKKLLCHLWENDIETHACCAGHPGEIYYVKETLFGSKRIDEETFYNPEKHGRGKYYGHDTSYCAYIGIKCENAPLIAADIQATLEEQNMPIPFDVSYEDGWVSIHQKHFDGSAKSHQFFDAIYDAVDHVFGIGEKEIAKEQPQSKVSADKMSLEKQMQRAATRTGGKAVTTQQKQRTPIKDISVR